MVGMKIEPLRGPLLCLRGPYLLAPPSDEAGCSVRGTSLVCKRPPHPIPNRDLPMLPEVLCLRLRRGYSLSSFPPTTRPFRRSLPSSRCCVARAKTRRPTRGIADGQNPSPDDLVMGTSDAARKQQSRVTGQQQLSYGEAKPQIKSSGNVATLPAVCRLRVRKAAHDKEPQDANACANVPRVWPSGRCASGGGRVDQVMSWPRLGRVLAMSPGQGTEVQEGLLSGNLLILGFVMDG